MTFIRCLITSLAKFFGIHPQTSANSSGAQPAVSLVVEKSAVAVVGGGRRPVRLRGKLVRVNCPWKVLEHTAAGALVLKRGGDVPAAVDVVITTAVRTVKKVGAGRRPESLEGLIVRVVATWTVREDHGDRVVLALNAAA